MFESIIMVYRANWMIARLLEASKFAGIILKYSEHGYVSLLIWYMIDDTTQRQMALLWSKHIASTCKT